MARILLADLKHSTDRLRRVLNGHALHAATTIQGAQSLLRRHQFNLIVCGFHFDDCHFMDFLMQVKKDKTTNDIPFVCWQNDRSELPEQAVGSVLNAAKVLGACMYLDFRQLKTMSDTQLRETLEGCLKPVCLQITEKLNGEEPPA